MATIINLTGKILEDGSAILCFQGPANRAVDWRILSGTGTLTPFTLFTDAYGRASCKFDAGGIPGAVVVGVAHVP